MNKLSTPLYTKKSWGSEVVWSSTDNYNAKTIDISANQTTPIILQGNVERSLVVIGGTLYLTCGTSDKGSATYELPEGWSWHIDSDMFYSYAAQGDPVTLIEISTPLSVTKVREVIPPPPPPPPPPKRLINEDIKPVRKRKKKNEC